MEANMREPGSYYCEMAGVRMKIEGRCKLYDAMKKEFALCESKDVESPVDLVFNISPDRREFDFSPSYYSLSGSIAFNDTDFSKKGGPYTYCVKNLFVPSVPTEIYLNYNESKSGIKSLLKVIYRVIFNNQGNINSQSVVKHGIMNYSMFWYVFAATLLNKGSAFIHSSIFKSGDYGVVLTGTSGCGKTSAIFKLFEREGTQYLSEDFGVVNADGRALLCAKTTSVYLSDVRFGQKDLRAYVDHKMKGVDKLSWNLSKLRKKNPMRKIPPELLLGKDRLADSAEIRRAYFFTRYSGKEVAAEEMELEDFVKSAANASFRELKMLYEVLKNINGVAYKKTSFPTIEELQRKTEEVYKNAFKNARLTRLCIPLKSAPDQIINVMEELER